MFGSIASSGVDVVGAGPAGMAFAIYLAREGVAVTLYDMAEEPLRSLIRFLLFAWFS